MQSQLQAAINQICAEKNLDKEVVIEAIENAIAAAYKREFGTPQQVVRVHLGDDISQLRVFEERTVVTKVADHDLEITLKEAKIIRPDAKLEESVYRPVEIPRNFGRIATQAAKQVISQKLQEAEREVLFQRFQDREGELLTARVQKVDRDSALLEIEGFTTLLPTRQQIRGEKYFTGQRLKVLLEKVEQTIRGPQIRITRSAPDFIVKLFEQEIPEMRDEIVYIAKMAREPGIRCKIAVASNDSAVDPVGAFVGQRGSRINVVMEEIGDERLDVIQFHEDSRKLLLSAMAPAKISKIEFEEEGAVKIYLPESERAVAIGRKGQNVRLAGQLVDCQVDVVTYDGPPDADMAPAEAPTTDRKSRLQAIGDEVTIDILGLDEDTVRLLNNFGLTQVNQFIGMREEDLIDADMGINRKQAEKIIKSVRRTTGQEDFVE